MARPGTTVLPGSAIAVPVTAESDGATMDTVVIELGEGSAARGVPCDEPHATRLGATTAIKSSRIGIRRDTWCWTCGVVVSVPGCRFRWAGVIAGRRGDGQ
ncbi:MAG: hypothetical protein QOD72_179 [Acidimicrobiaceae bacterium]|nr:hypothetical protein [Acidimicrobiaceae bacterium]